MSNEYVDPSGNTEQFKAFVHAPPEKAVRSRTPFVVGGIVVAAVVALVALLLFG